MKISPKSREPFVLLAGDLACFAVGLWLALYLRYLEVPSASLWSVHALPFSILSVFWIIVFFIAGLYEKHTLFFKRKLALLLINAQIANAAIAVAFFYAGPSFGINPKTNLLLYFLVSSSLLFFWRLYGPELLALRSREPAILIGEGEDIEDLAREVNQNPRYAFHFPVIFKSAELTNLPEALEQSGASLIVADFQDSAVASAIGKALRGRSLIRFLDASRLYEEIFDRMPLSLLKPNWALEYLEDASLWYSAARRIFDIVVAAALGLLSLVVYPFVWLALFLQDRGALFSYQERVGKDGKAIRLVKFRTMSFDDGGKWDGEGRVNKVTRVGAFLRKTRIDELPQLWNILMGDLSLIGPRPEFPKPVAEYTAAIPFYHLRHLITPGLSGWAQIYHHAHPHHSVDVVETARKLSYDLYYLKNRSLVLDLKIALKTIKTLLSRSGA
ncbi:MAG TPA: sugar transferase [Candidatus Paceibacterota bacterium]|nr:sugar transferase [Candidatus Paceibacterota bacterium]